MGRGDPLRADPRLREARAAQPARLPGALLSGGPPAWSEPLWRERAGRRSLDVLGIGQNSLDVVGLVERLPTAGEKRTLSAWHELPGGQIATAILACARLGLRTAYAGAVGGDAAADVVLTPLADAGVDLSRVRRIDGVPTRRALILVEAGSGERTILEHRDPALRLSPADVDAGAIADCRALLVDAEDPAVGRRAAGIAREAGIPSILDADHCTAETLALAREVDFPIVSQGFSEQFSSNASPDEVLEELSGARLAVVTLGERGLVAGSAGRRLARPARAVPARDTTGAGDVFRGAFVWALLQGWGAEAVLAAAASAAASSCRGLGAQGAIPDHIEPAAWR